MVIFYGVYKLTFTEETPAWAHRAYLLFMTLCSLVIPLQPFKISLGFSNMNMVPQSADLRSLEALALNSEAVPQQETTSVWTIIAGVYIAVSAILILRILWHFLKLSYLTRTAQKRREGKLVLLMHPAIEAPFSFFNYVFIHDSLAQEEHYKEIIAHEKIHATQYHSVDVILTEFLTAVFWFHPVVWMLKKRITLIHEYLADEGVLETGVDKISYQVLLLNQIAEGRLICLSSNFNHSLIKKRILMMSKSNAKARSSLRLLALIPVTLAMFLAIACSNSEETSSETEGLTVPPPPPPISMTDKSLENATFEVDGKVVSKAYIDKLDQEDIVTVNIIKEGEADKVVIRTNSMTNKKVNFETAKKLYVVNGEVQPDDFDVSSIDKENIESVNIIGDKDVIKKYTDKDYDGVLLITTR